MFLSPAPEGGEDSCKCPICREQILDMSDIGADSRDDRTAEDFRGKVKAFAKKRTRHVEEFRQERLAEDCALYQEIYKDGVVKLPGAIESTDPFFRGSFRVRQRSEGLDLHQAHALFIQLQQEGAFVPIDGKTCELDDTELYKNLRKARVFFNLRYNRWETRSGQSVFVSRNGYFGTEEQIPHKGEKRLKTTDKRPWLFS